MLKIDKLTKNYGKLTAVSNAEIEINEGEIYGFIGPNGAGKSTTIKCILDFLTIDDGKILFDGHKISNKDKEYIGYLPSDINLYEELTVKKMIEYNNSFYKKDCIKKARELCKKLQLDVTKKIENLSLGNLKKLGIVITLMHEPKLIILDEPTSGLDPLMQEIFYEILLSEKEKGNTIFFSTHNLSEVKRICDKVAIIKEGKILKIDDVSNLTKNNIYNVYIQSEELNNFKVNKKTMVIKKNNDNILSFIYKGNINDLIKMLKDTKVIELVIEEPSLDEVFLEYYKEN